MNVPKLRFKEFSGEWELKTLGNCSDSLDYGLNAAAKEFDGENQYLRITDIDDKSRKYMKVNRVSPEGNLTDDYLLKESDIVFARTGASTGKSYIYNIEDGKLYFAGFLIRVRISKEYNAGFIYNQTLTSNYNKWVKVMSVRSGQPGINSKEYASYEMSIPTMEEQNKITNFFTELDKKVQLQQEKINLLQEQKTGYMQKIFKQEIRFKDDYGGEYPEWEVYKLKDFVERVDRKNTENMTNHPLTISAQFGLVDQMEYFNKKVASESLTGYYLLRKGEFAYNKSYSKGYPYGAIKRLDRYEHGALSTLYICFSPNKNVLSDFLVQYFDSPAWYREVSMISVEGARNHGLLNVSVTDFFETNHKLPSLEEQIKISNFLSKLDGKIQLEQQKLEALQQQKKGFMEQMFI
ncbi:hypothetical protein CBR56_13455 [Bacillus thuringiensis]|uniref:restriction endonuclease subunit S n=1 Tax=Bacillus tropicus TaxID=2026188 RepID=UPI000B42FBEB|nr:restriction endonuclease subunit S [Bacillus tropicus]MED3034057.1 restriction endonuclease subunit S [Bacillus tropicus]OTX75639.1 hypothetical protein BK728_29015 [Bacillus thuringiensis serovar chanpaisis]PNK28936.1 hypothetical protein CBR56_13455 [Bacillus thuringiensis]